MAKVKGEHGGIGSYTSPYPPEIYLCVIVGTDNGRNHTIALWNGWVFDSNLAYAVPYSKDSLDWCSGGGEYTCEFKKFGRTAIFQVQKICI